MVRRDATRDKVESAALRTSRSATRGRRVLAVPWQRCRNANPGARRRHMLDPSCAGWHADYRERWTTAYPAYRLMVPTARVVAPVRKRPPQRSAGRRLDQPCSNGRVIRAVRVLPTGHPQPRRAYADPNRPGPGAEHKRRARLTVYDSELIAGSVSLPWTGTFQLSGLTGARPRFAGSLMAMGTPISATPAISPIASAAKPGSTIPRPRAASACVRLR